MNPSSPSTPAATHQPDSGNDMTTAESPATSLPSSAPAHTPTPWTINQWGRIRPLAADTDDGIYSYGGVIVPSSNHPRYAEAKANDAFIVEAVNRHADLLAENTRLRDALESFVEHANPSLRDRERYGEKAAQDMDFLVAASIVRQAKAALEGAKS